MRVLSSPTFFSTIALLLCIIGQQPNSLIDAKQYQVDAKSNVVTKFGTGFTQGLRWIYDAILAQQHQQHHTDREPRQMKVAFVGLGRTGTTSFVVALKKLGYVPSHDDDLPENADLLRGLLDGTVSFEDANHQLGQRGFDAAVITIHKYIEWLARPDNTMKVILTMRDTKKWATSFASINRVALLAQLRPFKWIPAVQTIDPYAREVLLEVPTNYKPNLYNDIPTLEAGFEAWNQFVIDTIPADRLLIFNVKEGWEPLCTFLENPIPEEPFPHVNDRLVMSTVIHTLYFVTWVWPLIVATPFFVVFWFMVMEGSTKITTSNHTEDDDSSSQQKKGSKKTN